MTHLLALCALLTITTSIAASQDPIGHAAVERARIEALGHYRAGQDALRSERFDVAELEFQKAAKLDPTLELAPYGLGQVSMATRRFRLAVGAFQKCRDVFQSNAVAVAGEQMAHERRIDDQIRALEDQQRIYQQPGRNANGAAAQAYLRQIDMQIQAMRDARRRTALGPEPTPGWISLALGSAYFRADAMTDAEREYRAAIAVDPRLGEAHSNLAVVYMMTGRYPQAEAEIAAAEKAGFKVNPQLKEEIKKAR